MYNPYCTELGQVLTRREAPAKQKSLLSGLSGLKEDDLLILLLLLLLWMDGAQEKNLPLLGALLYLLL